MSSIIQYQCSNKQCDFKFKRYVNFPKWKDGTPEDMMILPVGLHNQQYFLESMSKELCLNCNKTVSVEQATYICPSCYQACTFLKKDGECPKCHKGIVQENNEMLVQF